MTSATPLRVEELASSPELLALAPLLYVAWADGQLSAAERAAAAAHADGLSSAQREVLARWLDPSAPPTSTDLLRLYVLLRSEVGRCGIQKRQSLADLGLEIAARKDDDATRRALREVEAALGLAGGDAADELIPSRPAVAQRFAEPPPPFAPAALTRVLDGEYGETWQHIRQLLRREDFRYLDAPTKEAHRAKVRAWLRVLADEGVGALGFPREHGGQGRMDRFVVSFEALAMFDLSLVVKLGVQFGLFGGAILSLGTRAHHERYLRDIGSLSLLGGFAMTEMGHGSNVRELETVAQFDPARGVFVLHTPSASGRKDWIGNAAEDARAMVVFAQLDTQGVRHGVHAFVVPVRAPDGTPLPGVLLSDCGQKMGLNGVDNGRIAFDHVEVPREALLDRYAEVAEDGTYSSPIASPSRRFFTMLGTLVGGRVCVASASVTAAKSALTIAIRYGALRRQFGTDVGEERAILDYPAHQRRLLPRLAETYALHFAVADLQRRFRDHEGDDTRALETSAAALKAAASWHAIDASQAAREACGGMGFLSLNRVSEIRRDVDVFATFEGDNTVLLQLVAKSLLSGYAKELENHLFGTLLKSFARVAAAKVRDRNPFTSKRTDPAELTDPEFHRDALRFRTQQILASAARRVKKRIDGGMDPFDAFADIQDHILSLARAHTDEHVHGCFLDAVADCEDEAIRAPLERLRALYAVERLNAGASWFLENGFMEPGEARAMRKLVPTLCGELRPMAVPLVDAFGIPDEALAAPIAFERYVDRVAGTFDETGDEDERQDVGRRDPASTSDAETSSIRPISPARSKR